MVAIETEADVAIGPTRLRTLIQGQRSKRASAQPENGTALGGS
jgi:hypothetical protein